MQSERDKLSSLINVLVSFHNADILHRYRSHIMKATTMHKDPNTTHVMLGAMNDFLNSIYLVELSKVSLVGLIEDQAILVEECYEARRRGIISIADMKRCSYCLNQSKKDLVVLTDRLDAILINNHLVKKSN